MSLKLSAPIIAATIPAFIEKTELIVPFENNIIIAAGQVKGFSLIIKDLYGNIKGTVKTENKDSFNITEGWVKFNLEDINIKIATGFFYKIQIAYISTENTIGYYSSVGVIKYTLKPNVSILNLQQNTINILQPEFTGVYTNDDLSERLYSSYFVVKDSKGNIKQESKEVIHNSIDDIDNEQIEKIKLTFNYNQDDIYTIQFFVKTLNGVLEHSPEYEITQEFTSVSTFDGKIIVNNNIEDGYINIRLQKLKSESNSLLSGQYVLSRIEESNNERINLQYFNFSVFNYDVWSGYNDYLIENGKTYQYVFVQYDQKGLYSKEVVSDPITAKYDYAFLYDGKKQLKLKYNTNVSSFKENVLESKIDTIGNKYPFVFRNGSVKYKEFPISGLLKSEVIENENIRTNSPNKFIDDQFTDTYSIEQKWKIDQLEWLNNGEIKLFKSPTEGNYLVRLTNISLAPEQGLGGWLHNFSATAYEIAEINENSYLQYNFLSMTPINFLNYNYQSVNLKDCQVYESMAATNQISINGDFIVYDLSIIDMKPGQRIWIQLVGEDKFKSIYIGNTGSYTIKNVPIQKIVLTEKQETGILSFKYQNVEKILDNLKSISTNLYILSLLGDFDYNRLTGFSELYFMKPNKKYALQNLRFLQFEKRDFIIYKEEDFQIEDNFQITDIVKDPLKIYCKVSGINNVTGSSRTLYTTKNTSNGWDLNNNSNVIDNLYKIEIKRKNSDEKVIIDLNNKNIYNFNKNVLDDIESISIGLGIKVNLGFYLKTYTYLNEENNDDIKSAKQNFISNPSSNSFNAYIEKFNNLGG